jgi:23S rRNA (uracil1939-C5)-methyltransferase
MELLIERITDAGSGMARSQDGSVVFVSGAVLPGETVEAEVTSRKKDFSLARLVRVVEGKGKEKNPRRVAPRCKVFKICGGCWLQHAEYSLQLEIKASIVEDALERLGGFRDRSVRGNVECEASPRQWNYRNKASFPIGKVRGRPTAGFYAAGSHRVVPLPGCPVNAEPIERMFAAAQKSLPDLPVYDERSHAGALRHLVLRAGADSALASLVVGERLNAKGMKDVARLAGVLGGLGLTTFTLNHNASAGNVILGRRTEAVTGSGVFEERYPDGFTLACDTASFLQVNTEQAARLYAFVAREVGGRVLELYSGVGALTCYLARSASEVVSVEEWEAAVGMAEANMRRNGVGNVTCLKGRAEQAELSPSFDAVVLDPPRAGCERSLLDNILTAAPRRVVYVSCNPATLARDAKILSEGYELKSVRAFDMFPQTMHVETVAVLDRKE